MGLKKRTINCGNRCFGCPGITDATRRRMILIGKMHVLSYGGDIEQEEGMIELNKVVIG